MSRRAGGTGCPSRRRTKERSSTLSLTRGGNTARRQTWRSPRRDLPAHRASRSVADMPLLTLYINNKAGGLIYHRVSDPLDPAHTPALPTPSRARFSMRSQAEPKPSPKPSPVSRVAGLFQGGRETRHQRAAAASVHLQRPRDDYEGALARAALGPHGAARGRLVCPAIL